MHLIRYLLVSWALNAVVLGIVTLAFDHVTSQTFGDLVVAAAVFGVLNTVLKPILRLLTLPVAVVTLGLVWFAVSMLMLWLTSVSNLKSEKAARKLSRFRRMVNQLRPA